MTLIFLLCCAEIRNPECEGCSYYKGSQKFAIEKVNKSSKHFTMRIDPEVDDEVNCALEMTTVVNIAGGEVLIRSLMKENGGLYTVHFAMGTIYAYKEQYDEARACFDKSIEIFPYFVDCWFNKALAEQKKLDIVGMVFLLHKVIEIGDTDDETVLMANQHLKDFEKLSLRENGLNL
jgi:tetratricopeptide (TPR) repeat protein